MAELGHSDGRSGEGRGRPSRGQDACSWDVDGGPTVHRRLPADLMYCTAPCSAVVGGGAAAEAKAVAEVGDSNGGDGDGGGVPARRQFAGDLIWCTPLTSGVDGGGAHATVQDASRLQDAVEKKMVNGSVVGMEGKVNLDLNVMTCSSQISDVSCKRKHCKIAHETVGSEYTDNKFSCSSVPRPRVKISRPVKFGGFGDADAVGSSADAVVTLHLPVRNETSNEGMEHSVGNSIASPCQSRTEGSGNLMAGSSLYGYLYQETQQKDDVPFSPQGQRRAETRFRMVDLNMVPERSTTFDGEEVCLPTGVGKKQRVRGISAADIVDVDSSTRDVIIIEEHGDNFMSEAHALCVLRINSNGHNFDGISMGKEPNDGEVSEPGGALRCGGGPLMVLDLNTGPQNTLVETSVNVQQVMAVEGQNEGEIEVTMPVQIANAWKRRNRTTTGPDHRKKMAGRPSELQKAVMGFADRRTDYVICPEIGMEFDDIQEAYEYYNLYSWECGFGIKYGKPRYSNSRKNRNVPEDERYMLGRELNCSCSGRPAKNLKTTSSLTECPALLRLARTEDHGWVVVAHIAEHNHELSLSYGEKKQWPSHHHLDKYTKDLVRMLRENNVGITKLYSILGNYFGSMENVPTTKRCLKTLCQKINKEQAKDDIGKTLKLFRELRAADPGFVYSVDPDEKRRIKTLMWTNMYP